jgi:SAM-dependent methyltransferase
MARGNENVAQIASHWDSAIGRQPQLTWRSFPFILRWLHNKVCGQPINGPGAAGLNRVFKRRLNGRVLKKGISIGGGAGVREIELIKYRYVEEMAVYDLSPARIAAGRQRAEKFGVADRISFFCEDGMPALAGKYDLAFWHASLHHMFDTPAAVEASWNALNPGGYFWAVEYTGPSKAQYTAEMLDWATAIRRMFPEKYTGIREGFPKPVRIPVRQPRPYRLDPSEAVDSERIMPAVARIIPNAEVWPLGGIGYLIAFAPMCARFDPKSEEDEKWLQAMMVMDDRLSARGLNLKHAILAQKQ